MVNGALWVASLLLAAPVFRYAGSPLELEARKSGLVVVTELSLDIDGDGRRELAVVDRDPKGQMCARLFSVRGDAKNVQLVLSAETSPKRADVVDRFEARQVLGSPSPELLLVLSERSPDETIQHVRVLAHLSGSGPKEVFAHSFNVAGVDAAKRRSGPGELSFGDASPRVTLLDPDEEGEDHPISWTRGPQKLVLSGPKGEVTLVIGAYKSLFRFDPAQATFVPDREVVVQDFMPARPAWVVEASAQVPKIWGTAQAFWASDGDLETSWNTAGKTGGLGEWLKVSFKKPEPIALLRVVPGCAKSAEDWAAHERFSAFKIELSSGARFEVDRSHLVADDVHLAGVAEFPLEGGFGAQTLLLLKKREPMTWVRFVGTAIERGSEKKSSGQKETCLSEISFH